MTRAAFLTRSVHKLDKEEPHRPHSFSKSRSNETFWRPSAAELRKGRYDVYLLGSRKLLVSTILSLLH